MMAAYILRPSIHTQKPAGKLMTAYLQMVAWTLKHRTMTVAFVSGFFITSLMLASFLPSAFIPPDEMNQTQVSIELTPDATFDDTLRIAQMAVNKVKAVKGVESVLLTVGSSHSSGDPSSMRSGSVNTAKLDVKLSDRTLRASKVDIESQINQALLTVPAARFNVGMSAGGGEAGYVFSITGADAKKLDATAHEIIRQIRVLPMVASVINNNAFPRPELSVIPNELSMADKGVTTADLVNTLRVATQGDYDNALPKLSLDTRQVPIVTRLSHEDKQSLTTLSNLYVPSSKAMPVQIKDVASLKFTTGEASISRLDRERAIKITVLPTQGASLGDLIDSVKSTQITQTLPDGIHLIDEGQAEDMAELFTGLILVMAVGIFCIFAVLMLLFHRFLQPLTILMALPLSVGGAFIGLIVTGSSMSMPAMIGLILLMGIATKNSILLVDYAIIAQDEQGLSRFDVLIDACRKCAQPIIMTTIAMGAGMLPLVIGLGGVDSTFSHPMASAVIGGLVTSTLLSLVVIPVFYALMDDLGNWLKKPFNKRHRQIT